MTQSHMRRSGRHVIRTPADRRSNGQCTRCSRENEAPTVPACGRLGIVSGRSRQPWRPRCERSQTARGCQRQAQRPPVSSAVEKRWDLTGAP